MLTTFTSGLIAVVTPAIFISLLTMPFLFERLATNKRHHLVNAFLQFLLTAIGTVALVYHMLNGAFTPESFQPLAESTNVIMAFFLIMFLVSFRSIEWTDSFPFKILINSIGIIALSASLITTSFSSAGPILGSLMVHQMNNGTIDSDMIIMISGFPIGVFLPFLAILILVGFLSHQLRETKGWGVVQMIIGGLTLLRVLGNIATT